MESLNILFIGDIIGRPGLELAQAWLPNLIKKYKADFVAVNAENASDGKGCTAKEGNILFQLGVDVITGGNHTFDKHQSQDFIKEDPRALRPLNYPKGTYGNGYIIVQSKRAKVAVVNLQGRTFMPAIDCPFRALESVISKIKSETNIILVDFHAEASAEKQALAGYFDGRVSAILGTHTHVQTNDDQIYPQGTAYITDIGMTGPYYSVIGMKMLPAINRFLYQTPQKFEVAEDNPHLCGVYLKIDSNTGKALEIEKIIFPEFIKKR